MKALFKKKGSVGTVALIAENVEECLALKAFVEKNGNIEVDIWDETVIKKTLK